MVDGCIHTTCYLFFLTNNLLHYMSGNLETVWPLLLWHQRSLSVHVVKILYLKKNKCDGILVKNIFWSYVMYNVENVLCRPNAFSFTFFYPVFTHQPQKSSITSHGPIWISLPVKIDPHSPFYCMSGCRGFQMIKSRSYRTQRDVNISSWWRENNRLIKRYWSNLEIIKIVKSGMWLQKSTAQTRPPTLNGNIWLFV